MNRRFQFSLRALLLAMLVVAIASAGLAYLSPKERLMAIEGLLELAAWYISLGLPIALIVVCFAKISRKRRIVVCLGVLWLLAFAYTVWPLRLTLDHNP
ncbi:MAG TPA: hypothetical protein VG125_23655 [Pirellulales bacterium]|jgi:hypothetical protein|nr:hypothetical protein [Pirellulales bacterium]